MMENPSVYAAKIKALKEGRDINSVKIEVPKKKMTPRQKAASKGPQVPESDTREALRLQRQRGQEEQK